MKKNKKILPLLLAGAIPVLFDGCSTPASVRQLSSKTSANVAVLSGQLQKLAEGHAKIVEARAQIYAAEVQALADLRAKLDNLIAAQKIAGTPSNLALYQAILDESDRQAAVHTSLLSTQSVTLAQMENSLVALAAPSKQLDSLAARLSDLAAEESLAERASALYSFYNEVRSDVNKALDARDSLIKSLPGSPMPAATTNLTKIENLITTLNR